MVKKHQSFCLYFYFKVEYRNDGFYLSIKNGASASNLELKQSNDQGEVKFDSSNVSMKRCSNSIFSSKQPRIEHSFNIFDF
jgi:hypothetical protein